MKLENDVLFIKIKFDNYQNVFIIFGESEILQRGHYERKKEKARGDNAGCRPIFADDSLSLVVGKNERTRQ